MSSGYYFPGSVLLAAGIGVGILVVHAAEARAAPPSTPEDTVPSITGATGLLRVSTAEPDQTRNLRLALFGELSRATSFLVFGDTDTRFALHLATAMAPTKNVEIFAALSASGNDEHGASVAEPDQQAFSGGLTAGTKVASRVGRLLAVGAEVGIELPSKVSSLPEGASAWFDLLSSVDVNAPFWCPFRADLNVGYYVDNSAKRYDFSRLSATGQEMLMFADTVYGSRFRAAIGLEATAYERVGYVKVIPFAEYHYELVRLPVGDIFLDETPSNQDQQWLTAGARVRLGRAVTVSVSVDVALQSVGVPYGPPLPPFNVVAGTSVPIRW